MIYHQIHDIFLGRKSGLGGLTFYLTTTQVKGNLLFLTSSSGWGSRVAVAAWCRGAVCVFWCFGGGTECRLVCILSVINFATPPQFNFPQLPLLIQGRQCQWALTLEGSGRNAGSRFLFNLVSRSPCAFVVFLFSAVRHNKFIPFMMMMIVIVIVVMADLSAMTMMMWTWVTWLFSFSALTMMMHVVRDKFPPLSPCGTRSWRCQSYWCWCWYRLRCRCMSLVLPCCPYVITDADHWTWLTEIRTLLQPTHI